MAIGWEMPFTSANESVLSSGGTRKSLKSVRAHSSYRTCVSVPINFSQKKKLLISLTDLREGLCSAAVQLAESVKYDSAGTVEYLVDDKTGNFFFLEMNTQLQVEHGITELCYDMDLVQLMPRQADAQLAGKGGIGGKKLEALQPREPKGATIEAQVCAKNLVRDYAPSPGTLQIVDWAETDGWRIDTWVHKSTIVSSYYDPLFAKVMVHRPSRDQSIKAMSETLSKARICGPPTNLNLLVGIIEDLQFATGVTMTNFLTDFKYSPIAIDVVSGGAYTQVQDNPGRPTIGRGFPHSGPMDPLAFQIANLLVGNPRGTAGLECTLDGPELLFLCSAVVSIC